MQIDENSAVVDNDFLSHIIEIRCPDEEILQMLNIVFQELNVNAIMHPLVYDHELLQDKQIVKDIFYNKIIEKCEFDDILNQDHVKEAYYIFAVGELYKHLHGVELEQQVKANLLTFWRSQDCLGEIHSIAMCLVCGCGLFLSDDKDAKQLALSEIVKNNAFGSIKVYNRQDVVNRIKDAGSKQLNKSQRRALAHKRTR